MTPARIAATVLIAIALSLTLVAEPATAERDHRFHSGKAYRGSFPDPDVIRHRGTWVAAGTTIARRSLPVLTSDDGRTWRARRAHRVGKRRTNDAMVGIPRWAARKSVGRRSGARRFVPSWAPAIGRIGRHRWIAAYAAPVRHHPGKRCIGIATSRHATGPFRHTVRRPVVCPRRQGVIDPDVFRTRGRTFLLWKTQGVWGRWHTVIRVRELRRNGRGFRPHTRAHTLLRTARRWEGPLIENPSMIRYRGRLYLFYSANRWYTRRYAVGYAICRSVRGPCHRPVGRPLLASGHGIAGPGGQSALRGPRGQLLLAYAAWPARKVGTQRRLHIATLKARKHGRLVVARRFRR